MKLIALLSLLLFTFRIPYSSFLSKEVVKATKVEIKKEAKAFVLYKDGNPYYIKGAGGNTHLKELKQYGGNTLRTWSNANNKAILDEAKNLGLSVVLGLNIGRERLGFNYDDEEAVKIQFERIKSEVLEYKDHPALLMWAVGNEVAYLGKNDKVWYALNDLAKMIKELDPNHPVTTTLAGVPKDQVKNLIYKCKEIDLLAINAFQDLPFVPNKVREAGWKGPYIITEWGSTGYWEGKNTSWNAIIEETSTEKAEACKQRYESSIKLDTEKCLGSFIFYWGNKQERTHTLFSLFTDKNEKSTVVDAMKYLWTGTYPVNRTPEIANLKIDNKEAKDNIILHPGSEHSAKVVSFDYEKDPLKYQWEIYYESTEYHKTGGDYEQKPDRIDQLIKGSGNKIVFETPKRKGAYRLFISVSDGNNNCANANIPFYVN